MVRAWGDFDTGNVMTYLYVVGLVAVDVALLLLYRSMSRAGAPASVSGRFSSLTL